MENNMDLLVDVFRANSPFFIMGPCAIEGEEIALRHAKFIKELQDKHHIQVWYKSCFNKACRTDPSSFRGVGVDEGVRILKLIKEKYGLKVTSDLYTMEELEKCKGVVDLIQIPVVMFKETNFIEAIARLNIDMSVKKGKDAALKDVIGFVEKVKRAGHTAKLILIERGNSFGYENLVVDYRNIILLNSLKKKYDNILTCIDASHSAMSGVIAPTSEIVRLGARLGIVAGVDGVFVEAHENPKVALCDGKTSLYLNELSSLIESCQYLKMENLSLQCLRQQL